MIPAGCRRKRSSLENPNVMEHRLVPTRKSSLNSCKAARNESHSEKAPPASNRLPDFEGILW